MQDSIEDYIRILKNTKQEQAKPISKDILITLEKKKQCSARAIKIVEFAIDGKLHPEVFLKCLPYIDQSHFQDIVEERAITKLCGYPVCGKKIPEMPNKQYYISTKQNKVYDITDRKNYCSNFCYKAGIHIKKQIDTSPLWLRKLEDISKFNLLPTTESGVPGEEIDQGVIKPVNQPSSFTPVSSFTEVSLNDMIDHEIGKRKSSHIRKNSCGKKPCYSEKQMETILEDDTEESKEKNQTKKCMGATEKNETEENKRDRKEKEKADIYPDKKPTDENKSRDQVDLKTKTEKSRKPMKTKSSKSSKKAVNNTETHIKKCLSDWITLETHIYLFGDNNIKEKLSNDKFCEFFETLKVKEDQEVQQRRYIDMCRRLHLKELADEKFDKKVLGDRSLEPLPDYKKLKEESKVIDLKVKSFYGGTLYETGDPNFPSKSKSENVEDDAEEGPPAVLPLIDSKSQIALRRNIFLNSAKKSMQVLLQKLKIPQFSVVSKLQALVKTFELRADNIVLKPFMWNYISIALLKILSLKDNEIHEALESDKRALEYVNVVLNELPSKSGFVDYTLDLVKDSDFLIKKYLASNR